MRRRTLKEIELINTTPFLSLRSCTKDSIFIYIYLCIIVFSLVYLFYNQKIIDPCGTYIQSQVNTGINIGII